MSSSTTSSDDKTIYKLVFFVPPDNTQSCLTAIFSAGGGIWPNPPLPSGQADTSPPKYENCAFISKGTGQFRPSELANPHIGRPGVSEEVEEDRVEVIVVGREIVRRAVAELRKAHPYEVAAVFDKQCCLAPSARLTTGASKSILRRLLVGGPFISSTSPTDGLYPQILRVNKQLCAEGLDVLYGENYFRMRIWEKNDGERAYFIMCDHFPEEIQYLLPLYKLIQRYDIYVEIQCEEEHWAVMSAVRKVAHVLSGVPSLKHLRITLGGHEKYHGSKHIGEEVYACSGVLQPFALLRSVRQVDIKGGIRPRYAQYLKDIMEGRSPLNHLPNMCNALEYLAGPFEEFRDDLQVACDAMDDNDVPAFKRIRAELSGKSVQRVKHALDHLLDHDADQDDRQEWVIELRRRSKRGRSYIGS